MHSNFIRRAIGLAEKNIDSGGGPFGAIIVRNGEVIAEATNKVTLEHDATAHAEVLAIRNAGKILKNFDLSDCILYTSCEPCPMCLGAIYWAHIPEVYYASDRLDAERAGFDDSFIYKELEKPLEERSLKIMRIEEKAASELFNKWNQKTDKERY